MKFTLIALALVTTNVFAAPVSAVRALALLERLEVSGYGTRSVCVKGNDVFGIVPGQHWSLPSSYATGTVKNFPQNIEVLDFRKNPLEYTGKAKLLKSEDGVEFYLVGGKINGAKADLCVYESKPVLE